jgi:tagatose 1,6-diphosphate aldolase
MGASERPEFEFLDPGRLVDGELELVLTATRPGRLDKGLAPEYAFDMRRTGTNVVLGSINLRIGETEFLTHYAGQIGYGVEPEHRGHHYAARATRLLLPLAASHGLSTLWITVNPDNLPSRRTCEIAGGELVEIVDLPPGCDMYRKGERQKCRYRIRLG